MTHLTCRLTAKHRNPSSAIEYGLPLPFFTNCKTTVVHKNKGKRRVKIYKSQCILRHNILTVKLLLVYHSFVHLAWNDTSAIMTNAPRLKKLHTRLRSIILSTPTTAGEGLIVYWNDHEMEPQCPDHDRAIGKYHVVYTGAVSGEGGLDPLPNPWSWTVFFQNGISISWFSKKSLQLLPQAVIF